MAFDAFISFSQKDKATADAACAMLEANGVKCWIAPRNIPYGKDYGSGIIEGINQSRMMVLIFSSHANDSKHVHREVERAVNRGMPIIPFRIQNVAPSQGLEYFLSLPNWLDAFTPPLEPYLSTLVTVVTALKEGRPQPQPVVTRPDGPYTPPPAPPGPRPVLAYALGALLLGAVGVGASVYQGWLPLPGGAAKKGEPASEIAARPAAQPATSVVSNDRVISFAGINTANVPGYKVAAAPYLHQAAMRITIEDIRPQGSQVVFVNNMGLYEGKAVAPTTSQTFLTQQDTGNVEAAFTLKFAQPVAAVSFVVPKVWPATESGITFPGWKAIALSASGTELSSTSLGLVRRFADVPAQTHILRAPAFEGIAAVRFVSDPRLPDGTPFAAFSAIVIEEIMLTLPD